MKKESFIEENDEYMVLDPNMVVHPNPAPRKMALALAFIEEHGLPSKKKQKKKVKKVKNRPKLTNLQTELLNFYDSEPTEMQMQQLQNFLFQLLNSEAIRYEQEHKAA